MTPEFVILGRRIGDRPPSVVIAEIGINHEGSLGIAMVDAEIPHSGSRREVRL